MRKNNIQYCQSKDSVSWISDVSVAGLEIIRAWGKNATRIITMQPILFFGELL